MYALLHVLSVCYGENALQMRSFCQDIAIITSALPCDDVLPGASSPNRLCGCWLWLCVGRVSYVTVCVKVGNDRVYYVLPAVFASLYS